MTPRSTVWGTEVYRSPWFQLAGYRATTVRYSDGRKRTVLEHREAMEETLGRRLVRGEHVHHKDGSRDNNDPSNLELLTDAEHARAHAVERGGPEMVDLTCDHCSKAFRREARTVRHAAKQGKRGAFCGRRCARLGTLARPSQEAS